MKIHAITASNYIGARDIAVRLRKPVALFAGDNYAGKSSLAEAIKHALTGECTRVGLKKDYGALVCDAGKAGHCIVETDAGKCAITLPNGKHEITFEAHAALPYVLDAQRFAKLDAKARGAFLLQLANITDAGAMVRAELLTRGCRAERVEAIVPLLRAGFEAAEAEAKRRTSEARGAWKQITGEVYGSQKAMTWTAPRVSWDQKKLAHGESALASWDKTIEEAQAAVTALETQQRMAADQGAKLNGLRQVAIQYARMQVKLNVDEPALAEWEAKVRQTEEAASGGAAPRLLACPCCGVQLMANVAGDLVKYEAPAKRRDPEAAAVLPEYIKARDLLKRAVENDRIELNKADQAARTIKAIEDDGLIVPVTDEQIAAARQKVADAKHARKGIEDEVREARAARDASASADDITRKAGDAHADVMAWETIAQALAPDGIPADWTRKLIGPINARLADSADFTTWLKPEIHADMSITADGRPYSLLSESEKFRVDAQIAEAVAHTSGVRVLMLDRVDVLNVVGRIDLVEWLDRWAEEGEIDSALLFGTFQKMPDINYPCVDVFWIQAGKLDGLRQQKAA